jgi:RecG-like helicase
MAPGYAAVVGDAGQGTGEASVGRRWSAWTRSQDEVEAVELSAEVVEHGAEPIAGCQRGRTASVHGTIRSVTVRPLATSPSLEAEVYDGSGHITLVWIGYRKLAGVDAGRVISASGRVTCPQGRVTIFNPSYRLYPTSVDSIA